MKHGTIFASMATVLLGTVLVVPNLEARVCSGTGDVLGSYGFIGTRDSFFLLGATAPGTTNASVGPMIPVAVTPPATTTAVIGSNTPIGALVAGLANPNVFSASGTIIADGLGNLFAAASTGVAATTLVGSYTVNSDCSVSMSITDTFSASTTVPVPGTVIKPPASVTLVGELINSAVGAEVDLVQTGVSSTGGVVTMRRMVQMGGCTTSNVSGNFTIGGQGMLNPTAEGTLPTVGTSTGAFTFGAKQTLGIAFTLLGRFNADGLGNLTLDAAGLASPSDRILIGSYTVNPDCTGTAHLIVNTTSSAVGVTPYAQDIKFNLVNLLGFATNPPNIPAGSTTQLDFVFSNPGVFGSGRAAAQ